MPYTDLGKNSMLDFLASNFVSAHTGDPTLGNEVVGGSYIRKSISFSAAVGGSKDSDVVPNLDIPSGNTVTYVGFYDAQSGGNLVAYKDIPSTAFTSDGVLSITDADLDLNL